MAITASVVGGDWNTNAAWVGGVQPTAADDVLLTATSGNVNIPAAVTALCRSIDCTAYTGTLTFAATTSNLNIGDASGGAAKFVAGMTLTLTGIGTINFLASTASTTYALTTGGKVMPNLTVNTGSTTTIQFADAVTATGATITVTSGTLDTNGQTVTAGSFSSSNSNTRTLTLGASAITLTGSGTALNVATSTNFTLSAGTSTVTLSGAGVTFQTGANAAAWYNISFTGSGTALLSPANNTSFNNLTRTGTAAKTDALTISTATALTVAGSFTLNSNSSINRLIVQSNTVGTTRTITAASLVCTNIVDFQDITGAGAATWTTGASGATAFGDCGGNSGITMTASTTRYAYAGATKNWSSTTMWDAVSTTGGGGASVPLPQDTVIFDSGTGAGTYTIDMPRAGKNLTCTGFTRTLNAGSVSHTWFGSFTLAAGMTYTSGQAVTFAGRGSHTLTFAGKSFSDTLNVTALGGTYTMQDAFTGTFTLSVSNGTLDTNSQSVTTQTFVVSGTATKGVTLGASSVTLTGTSATPWNFQTTTGLTFSGGSSTIIQSGASASTRTFAGGGQTYGTLTYTVADSPGTLIFTGANTFTTINVASARSLTLPSSTTTNVTNFNVTGEARDYIYLPAVSGSYISTPNAAANRITGDITIDVKLAATDWTPAAQQVMLCKQNADVAYQFNLETNGRPRIAWKEAAGTIRTAIATAAPVVSDGSVKWLRVSFDVDNGAGQYDVRFYSSDDGSAWTQLGATVTGATGVTNIKSTSDAVEIGSVTGGTAFMLPGKFYNAKVYNSDLQTAAGTAALSFDADAQVTTFDTYTSGTGEVWTLNGLAKQGDGRFILVSGAAGTAATLATTAGASVPYVSTKDITATPSNAVYVLDGTNVSGNTGIVFEPNSAQHPSLRNASLAALASSVGANGAVQRAVSW